MYMQVDAVGEWTRQSCAMTFEVGDGTSTMPIVAAGVATGARITGRDQGKARGKSYGARGAGDDHDAVFEGLS